MRKSLLLTKKNFFIATICLLLFNYPIIGLAAMEPSEINKQNSEAPYHLIGAVIADELVKDISGDENLYQHLRKMTIEINQIITIPEKEELGPSIEVFYHYRPSWQDHLYVGGKRMDIAINDVIEIWLEDGEHGLEPVLSGNSVEHIEFAENRKEPIPEPFWEMIKRKLSTTHSEVYVLAFLFLVLVWVFYRGLRKKNFTSTGVKFF